MPNPDYTNSVREKSRSRRGSGVADDTRRDARILAGSPRNPFLCRERMEHQWTSERFHRCRAETHLPLHRSLHRSTGGPVAQGNLPAMRSGLEGGKSRIALFIREGHHGSLGGNRGPRVLLGGCLRGIGGPCTARSHSWLATPTAFSRTTIQMPRSAHSPDSPGG